MERNIYRQPARFGMIGFLLGLASLIVILIQFSAIFEPQNKTAGSIIGEIAADIKLSATRAMTGETPPPASVPTTDYRQIVTIAALVVAGLAAVLGGIGIYRDEPRQLSFLAIGIGLSALVMQFVFWLAVLICGVVLLSLIIKNLDSIIS